MRPGKNVSAASLKTEFASSALVNGTSMDFAPAGRAAYVPPVAVVTAK